MRLRCHVGRAVALWAMLGAAVSMFSPPYFASAQNSQDELRALLPSIEDASLTEKLQDAYFFTEESIPRVYQHNGGVHSAWYNISADNGEPFGNANREFPWGTPAGAQRVDNLYKFGFVILPRDDRGNRLPIVWFGRPAENGVTANIHYTNESHYAWVYPKGAIVGEVLCLNRNGSVIPFEVRTRRRELQSWEVAAYRPFPTAKDLLEAVRYIPGCEQLVAHLEGPPNVVSVVSETRQVTNTALRIRSTHPNSKSFEGVARLDELPAIKEDIVTWLLYHPFKEVQGEWKEGCFSPTTKEAYHIVPAKYRASHVPVDNVTCMQCHKETNAHVRKFQVGRDWYGFVRGSDGIFSLHPFSASSISHNGFTIPVSFNKKLVDEGIFAPHNPREHSSTIYKQIKGIR